MTSGSVKAIQDKLFRGGDDSSGPGSPGDSDSRDQAARLTIQIPKPTLKSEPAPKPSRSSPRASNGSADGSTQKSYRQRLGEKLGASYQGVERYRLQQDDARLRHWKRWGPYVSDRQWVSPPRRDSHACCSRRRLQATVREDYSENGDAWSHFPHEHARSRAYRWGEDGIGGISDNHQRLCFSLSLWNGEDRILKERLFGVTGHQGNHGEDVKELYYYLDSTPSHSYMKFLYKYPQRRYPYEELVTENVHRDRHVAEYEILDSDVFEDDRYWDVFMEVRLLLLWLLDLTIHHSMQKTRMIRIAFTYGLPATTVVQKLRHSISYRNCGSAIHGPGLLPNPRCRPSLAPSRRTISNISG